MAVTQKALKQTQSDLVIKLNTYLYFITFFQKMQEKRSNFLLSFFDWKNIENSIVGEGQRFFIHSNSKFFPKIKFIHKIHTNSQAF